jgi:hypothetical protein
MKRGAVMKSVTLQNTALVKARTTAAASSSEQACDLHSSMAFFKLDQNNLLEFQKDDDAA